MGNRLYVGNLPFSATAEALREAFAASGDVADVHIVTDREDTAITIASQAQALDRV